MQYRKLGKSGLEVSEVAPGTMQFGWSADGATAFAIMDAYVEGGGNLIDAADIYLEKLAEIGTAHGCGSSQVALAWLLSQPLVTAPIIGAQTVEQLRANLLTTGLRLSEDELRMLERLSDWREA